MIALDAQGAGRFFRQAAKIPDMLKPFQQFPADIKKNIEASIALQPAQTKDIPAGEKPAYLDKYKAYT